MSEAIRFFCGINEHKWNGTEIDCGEYACVAPVYGGSDRTRKINPVTVPQGTAVMQDSGAFSFSNSMRPDYPEALEMQLQHAEQYKYDVRWRVGFDLLADEVWDEHGVRHKTRHSAEGAQIIIDETVKAARFLSRNRLGIPHLVHSVQGVTPQQYAECTQKVLDYTDPRCDTIGLGGWCIIGKRPKQMMPVFRESLRLSLPLIAHYGVKHIHIFGVIYANALGVLLRYADCYGLQVSTDSAGPSVRPAAFGQWGYADWKDQTYIRKPPHLRGPDRIAHVQAVRDWLANFRSTIWYKEAVL